MILSRKQKNNDMKGLWESWIKTGNNIPEKKYFGILNKKTFSIITLLTLLLLITANAGIYYMILFKN